MYYGLYMSAAGAHAQSQKVEVLSNNLANVDTVGFKRELALLEARDSEAIERGMASPGSRSLNDIGGGTRMRSTATDFQLGTLRQTGMPTDFALERPDGFFQVQRGDQRLLTRAGNFHLDTDGRLLTQQGDAVLTSQGLPVALDPTLPWRTLPGGVIDQAGEAVELGIFKPSSLANLVKVGQNFFEAEAGITPVPANERSVRSGYLELSSVNSVEEMVDLIAASRSYETNVRMIQQHDTVTGSLIGRILRA